MSNVKFKRKIEDFVCENCGKKVKGDGFTNHCPVCLWSKHVDINPGDRASKCQGKMRPVRVEKDSEEYALIHQCIKCGHKKRNKVNKGDNFEEIIKLAEKNYENYLE